MRRLFILPIFLYAFCLSAQQTAFDDVPSQPGKVIKRTVAMEESTELALNFPYATDIRLSTARGNEIEIYVNASINSGENNEAYELLIARDGDRIMIGTDRDQLDSFFRKNSGRQTNCYSTDIMVEIAVPSQMVVSVESISGNVVSELRTQPYAIKTISGDIDLTIPGELGAELIASTISGAMYADISLEHLDSKEGLRQLVGEKVHANINQGGEKHRLETISGDVLLRAGN